MTDVDTREPPFDPDYDTPPPPTHNGHRNPDRTNSGATTKADVHQAAQEAEHAFLGTLLTLPQTAARHLPLLDPADYYQPRHEAVHTAMATLLEQGTLPDHPALIAHLHATGTLQTVGGHEYLLQLRDHAGTQPEHYATTIRDAAGLRRLDTHLTKIRHRIDTARPEDLKSALADLSELADAAAVNFGPTTSGPDTGLHDLRWVATGDPPQVPPPVICRRSDDTALFYAGKVNGIFGDPECAKTWLAQAAGVEALNTGGTLAMIDVDHNGPDHTSARLLLLGARLEHIADPERFRYYEPEDAHQLTAAVDDITTRAPTVVIIDSLGEIFPMLGVNTNDGDEITTAMRRICTRPAVAGSCVITIDHLPKSHEARTTGYAIGSIAKKRMIRGSYLRAEARTQPAPGQVGRITLRIEKDTAGELRKSSGGGYAGTFTLDSTAEHVTTWRIGHDEMPKNDDGTFRPTGYMEKVATFIAENDGCTQNDIETNIPGTAKHKRTALQILVTEGHVVRQPGPRRSWLHSLTIPYREAEDDHAQLTL